MLRHKEPARAPAIRHSAGTHICAKRRCFNGYMVTIVVVHTPCLPVRATHYAPRLITRTDAEVRARRESASPARHGTRARAPWLRKGRQGRRAASLRAGTAMPATMRASASAARAAAPRHTYSATQRQEEVSAAAAALNTLMSLCESPLRDTAMMSTCCCGRLLRVVVQERPAYAMSHHKTTTIGLRVPLLAR